MPELSPKPRTPEDIAERIETYFDRTGFSLEKLNPDRVTLTHWNGITETVESDMVNVLGALDDRVNVNERSEHVLVLGMIIGAALQESGHELPEPYKPLVELLVGVNND